MNKTTPHYVDLAAEIRWREVECQRLQEKWSRQKRRLAAFLGVTSFAVVVGIALGSLIASGAHWCVVVSISAWGCWGLSHLITRH